MNTFFITLFVIIVLIIAILFIYSYYYNKINELIIRYNEAEVRIDNNLRDKYDLLSKEISLIKTNIEVNEDIVNEINKLKVRKISNFNLDRTLVKVNNDINVIITNNKELKDIDELYRINKQIELIDEELITLRNYYNGNISEYNKMIKKIPSLVVAKIKKYQEKSYYDLKDMNDNDYEDFKL